MFSGRIVLTFIVGFLLFQIFAPGLSANDQLPEGTEVEFIVPVGTTIATGTSGEKLVFTGRADAIVSGFGNCGFFSGGGVAGTQGPLHPAVSIDPRGGGSVFHGNVIVTHVNGGANDPSPVPPGTRLSSIVQLNVCGTTNEFQKYRGVVD